MEIYLELSGNIVIFVIGENNIMRVKNIWSGPYHVQCPGCKGRNIRLVEVTEGTSSHIIRNGEWDQSEDNNEYGLISRSEMTCLDCGHRWTRRGFSIDSYLRY